MTSFAVVYRETILIQLSRCYFFLSEQDQMHTELIRLFSSKARSILKIIFNSYNQVVGLDHNMPAQVGTLMLRICKKFITYEMGSAPDRVYLRANKHRIDFSFLFGFCL